MLVTWGAQGWELLKWEEVAQSCLEPRKQDTELQKALVEVQEKQWWVSCQVRQVSWVFSRAGPSAGLSPWSHPGWRPQDLGLAFALLSAVPVALALTPAADPTGSNQGFSDSMSATPTHGGLS